MPVFNIFSNYTFCLKGKMKTTSHEARLMREHFYCFRATIFLSDIYEKEGLSNYKRALHLSTLKIHYIFPHTLKLIPLIFTSFLHLHFIYRCFIIISQLKAFSLSCPKKIEITRIISVVV